MLSATSLWIANGPLISDRKIWLQICFPEFASYKTDRTFNRSAERWILLSNRVATSNSLAFRQSTREKRAPGFRKPRAVSRKRDNHLLAIFGNSPDDAIPRLSSGLRRLKNPDI